MDGITSILFVLFLSAVLFGIFYSVSQSTHRTTREALSALSKSFDIVEKVRIVDQSNKSYVIDYVVMSKKGVYLLKVVDRKGIIFGDESQARWSEKINNQKEEFNNPIKEVVEIIRGLRNDLDDVATDIPIYPIVVFNKEADFSNLFCDSLVIRANALNNYLRNDEEIITNVQLDNIRSKLIPKSQRRSQVA